MKKILTPRITFQMRASPDYIRVRLRFQCLADLRIALCLARFGAVGMIGTPPRSAGPGSSTVKSEEGRGIG